MSSKDRSELILRWDPRTLSWDMAFPVAEPMILAAETVLGRRFPEPLRSRISRSNGGEISTEADDWLLHPVRDHTDRKRFTRSACDITQETETARQWPRFPSEAIAVASNGTGDFLVLLPNSNDLWLWEHETGEIHPSVVQWT